MPPTAGTPPADAPVTVDRGPVFEPLRPAALALVAPSATAAELGDRLTAAGVVPADGVPEALLADLAALGLVRVARTDMAGRRFVPTSLGQQVIDAGLTGEAAVGLEALERLRTDLLATIAHELRTPLTAVRTGVGLLQDPSSHPSADQHAALLAAIERNADRMMRLVGDILELARFRAGGVPLQLRRFGALALADAAAVVVGPLAAGGSVHLVPSIAVPPHHEVYGDRRRLEQALVNLLANAIRFSPAGGQVRLRVETRGDLTAWVVSDNGPGIPDDDVPRLFERFFVGRGDRSGPRSGIGLGLPTALAIAQAHGGTIEVASRPGRGSTFALVVPSNGPADGDDDAAEDVLP